MGRKVYGLKRATPKMKYQHMKMVMDWRADLMEKQADYAGEGVCPICNHPIQSRPLFMVGEYDMCYSCFRILELNGIHPPKLAKDLNQSAVDLVLSSTEMTITIPTKG